MIKQIKTSQKLDAALDEMMKLIELSGASEINFLSIYNKKENFERSLNELNIFPSRIFIAEDSEPKLVSEKEAFEQGLDFAVSLYDGDNNDIIYVYAPSYELTLYFRDKLSELEILFEKGLEKLATQKIEFKFKQMQNEYIKEIESLKNELARYKTTAKNVITKKTDETEEANDLEEIVSAELSTQIKNIIDVLKGTPELKDFGLDSNDLNEFVEKSKQIIYKTKNTTKLPVSFRRISMEDEDLYDEKE